MSSTHPFQRAKRKNLDILLRLYKSIEKEDLPLEEKTRLLRANFIKATGSTFRKMKEYAEDLGLDIQRW